MKRTLPIIMIATSALVSGCFGPSVRRQFDDAAETVYLSAGRFNIGFVIGLNLDAEISPAIVASDEEPFVRADFPFATFDEVFVHADGETLRFRRFRFHDTLVRIPFSDFVRIGRAKAVGFVFDSDDSGEIRRFDRDDMVALHRFAGWLEHYWEKARRAHRDRQRRPSLSDDRFPAGLDGPARVSIAGQGSR